MRNGGEKFQTNSDPRVQSGGAVGYQTLPGRYTQGSRVTAQL